MNSKYLLLTLYFFSELLFCLNISPYPELEIDKPKQFKKDDLNEGNTLYAFSKNSVTGVFVYDIDSPVPLTLGYATSDNKDTLPTLFDSHHNENITQWKTSQGYNYFFSMLELLREPSPITLYIFHFIEIIQLNFCGLSYMTKKNIEQRAKLDSMLIYDENNENTIIKYLLLY